MMLKVKKHDWMAERFSLTSNVAVSSWACWWRWMF